MFILFLSCTFCLLILKYYSTTRFSKVLHKLILSAKFHKKSCSFSGSKSIADCVPVCGYGTYSPTGLVPCLECPRNSYTGEPPTDGFKDCQACPANTYTYQPAAGGKEHCRGDLFSWLLSFLHFKIQRMQDGVLTSLLPWMHFLWDVMLDCWVNSPEVSNNSVFMLMVRLSKEEGAMICCNMSNYIRSNTVLYHGRLES